MRLTQVAFVPAARGNSPIMLRREEYSTTVSTLKDSDVSFCPFDDHHDFHCKTNGKIEWNEISRTGWEWIDGG